jgi:hypothetical protein
MNPLMYVRFLSCNVWQSENVNNPSMLSYRLLMQSLQDRLVNVESVNVTLSKCLIEKKEISSISDSPVMFRNKN